MSLICLSRTMDSADLAELQTELHYVDHHIEPPQAYRRWQYASALHAVGRWVASGNRHLNDTLYEITHHPSTFHLMLDDWTERDTVVINYADLAGFVTGGTPLAEVVVAHSVVEHAAYIEPFLYRCSCLLAPGGLLVLTFAFWNHCGPDTAHGHAERQRIYCPKLTRELRDTAASYHLAPFGGVDPAWHGPHHHDYSFASLVLEKKR
jgi:hypothetical protein